METLAETLNALEAKSSALDSSSNSSHELPASTSVSSHSSPLSCSSDSPINASQPSPALQNPTVYHQSALDTNVAVFAYRSTYSAIERQQTVFYTPYSSATEVAVNNRRTSATTNGVPNHCYSEGSTSNMHSADVHTEYSQPMVNAVRHNQYSAYCPFPESLSTYGYHQYGPMQPALPGYYSGSNAGFQNSAPPSASFSSPHPASCITSNNNSMSYVNQNVEVASQDPVKTLDASDNSKLQKSPGEPCRVDSPLYLGESPPPCSVCGDVGSGIHYGVWACEGCKGFFRRAVMRNPQEPGFTCFYGSECDVNRENRNKCRACRLRRCQEAGMVYGAGLKDIQKKRREISHPTAFSLVNSRSTVDVQQLTESIVTAHMASFTSVSEVFTSRYAAVLSLGPDQLWPPGGDLSQRGVQSIQQFAHALPFIMNLSAELRTALLEQNAIDMMLLRVAFRYCIERDSFLFPPGAEVTLPCLSATLIGSQTTSRLAALGRSVSRLGMSSEDLAFLSTLTLLSSDAVRSSNLLSSHTGMLIDIRKRVLRSFDWYVHQRVSMGPTLIGKMVSFLTDVRAVELSVPAHIWLEPAVRRVTS